MIAGILDSTIVQYSTDPNVSESGSVSDFKGAGDIYSVGSVSD
jgi:hypothetical protein